MSSREKHEGDSESRKRTRTALKSCFLKHPECKFSLAENFRRVSVAKTWPLSRRADPSQRSSHENGSNGRPGRRLKTHCWTETSYSRFSRERKAHPSEPGWNRAKEKKGIGEKKEQQSKEWTLSCQTCQQQPKQKNVCWGRRLLCC